MSANGLVDEAVLQILHRITSRLGPVLIEQIPSVQQITDFFHSLQALSTQPLQNRLLYNPKDASVFLTHSLDHLTIHLSTVTHDYTCHCRDSFSDRWSHPVRVDNVQRLPEIMDSFDTLQKHLLNLRPSYLHQIEYNDFGFTRQGHSEGNRTSTSSTTQVVVFTAYRYASHAEPALTETAATTWVPYGHQRSPRHPTPTEATLWAIEHLIMTSSRNDIQRLRHIAATVRAVFATRPPRRTVPYGNSTALLVARQSASRTNYGRVRHALLHSVIHDRSLLREGPPFYLGAEEPIRFLPSVRVGRKFLWVRFTLSVLLLASFVALAIHFTFVQPLPVFFVVLLWIFVAISVVDVLVNAFSARVPLTARELVKNSVGLGDRMQVDLATGRLARSAFNGARLSFSGLDYVGHKDYNGPHFRVSQLMNAGYETSFCMDGREALVTPTGNLMRLRDVNSEGGAFFIRAESEDPQLETAVVPGVRGTWASDIATGQFPRKLETV